MDKIYTKARAKINLTLRITEKRADNYHNIESIFQRISLYDEMYIEKTNTNDLEIISNVDELNDKSNIIYKAYISLKEQYGQIKGLKVKLNKKIPMQAGLGGGSADCASFIKAINKLFSLDISKIDMEKLASKLGADVVPCLHRGVFKAQGIGDIISKIETNLKYYVLVVKPKMQCSTKLMFEKIDNSKNIVQSDNDDEIIEILKGRNPKKLKGKLYNVFEEVMENKQTMDDIKKEMLSLGAIDALLTGSGSCVYGIYGSKEEIRKAYSKMKKSYESYMCVACK